MAGEHLIFVYGTLKEGFRNFHINRGRRVEGEFVTVVPHRLYIVGPYRLPWLLEGGTAPEARHVAGEVFGVDDKALAEMDALERIDEVGWYLRRRLALRPRDDAAAAPIKTWVYFGSPEGLAEGGVHLGPLTEYTLAHQALLPRELWATAAKRA